MYYKYVIVGAGLAGLTIAERIANLLNEQVLLIEKRGHIGGNIYDFYNEDGILIHKYGPHIFHTNDQEVYEYLSTFTKWNDFWHRVLSYVDGNLIPMPITVETINKLYHLNLSCEQVKDTSVISRIPVRYNRDTRYFADKYQGMPKYGYTKMCEAMASHPNIRILLQTNYKEILSDISYDTLIFTGPADEFYQYKFGHLAYRSLRLEFETFDKESYQPAPVVNYPNDYDFTRITEYKKLTGQEHKKTTIGKEFPCAEGEPYYPFPTKECRQQFALYQKEMEKETNVFFLGRLAEYRYYNMDAVVRSALDLFETKIKKGTNR